MRLLISAIKVLLKICNFAIQNFKTLDKTILIEYRFVERLKIGLVHGNLRASSVLVDASAVGLVVLGCRSIYRPSLPDTVNA